MLVRLRTRKEPMSRVTKELAKYYSVGQLRAAIKIRQATERQRKASQQASRSARRDSVMLGPRPAVTGCYEHELGSADY